MENLNIKLHFNVVSFLGISRRENAILVVEEACEGQSLYDVLHNSASSVSWEGRLSIAKQVAQGLLFLHYSDPPIVHRCLTSRNVKFTYPYDEDRSPKVKISSYNLDIPFESILQK